MEKNTEEVVYCKKCNKKMNYSLYDMEGCIEEIWECQDCKFICSLDYPCSKNVENNETEIRKV